jgi:DNA-binding NtrC family response regulator
VDDIPYLASHFRDQFAREAGFPVVPFSGESIDWLASHEWPGNVRELKHAVERAIVLSRGADEITPAHFGYGTAPIINGLDGSLLRHVLAGWDLKRLEEEYIRAVIYHTDGHRGEAAEILGIDRRTLYRKLDMLES